MKKWQLIAMFACFGALLVCVGALSWQFTRKATIKEIGLVSSNYLVIQEHPVKVENFVNKYAFSWMMKKHSTLRGFVRTLMSTVI